MNTNLLDLNNDILNVIGDYVKKDKFKRALIKEEQILNWKKIIFDPMNFYTPYCMYDENYEYIKDNNNITKDSIKEYIYFNISMDIIGVNKYAKTDKIKLSKIDIRMCIWVCF